ncbi:MAG: hypothetical protein ACRDL4_07540 [Thermoleophilaceae bacterium]
MPYTVPDISELLERYDTAIERHRRAAGAAEEELNADLDALTAQLSDAELDTVGRYLQALSEGA